MALHELNLWNINSRTGSSLDVGGKYGGLTSGRIDLPASAMKAKGFRVRIAGTHSLESYANLNALVTGIGGTQTVGLSSGMETVIEFDTSKTSSGARGVYSVEGIFVRDWHPHDALTKGEAMNLIDTFGVDTYRWSGTETIAASSNLNLLTLNGLGTDITQGDSTINAAAMVILPVAARPRGVMITVILDGEYEAGGSGYQDFRIQMQGADGTTVMQTVPLFVPNKKLEKSSATFPVFTNGVYDELSTTGFKLMFLNDSNSSLTLKDVEIIVQDTSNPDFTRA